MQRRPKPAKRPRLQRVDRPVHIAVPTPARIHRVPLRFGLHVDVIITRNRRWMREAARRLSGDDPPRDALAFVHTKVWRTRLVGSRFRHFVTRGRRLARVYFNVRDLQRGGADTVAHESLHLAMRLLERQRQDVYADEEALADLVGEFAQRINDILHAHGAWG